MKKIFFILLMLLLISSCSFFDLFSVSDSKIKFEENLMSTYRLNRDMPVAKAVVPVWTMTANTFTAGQISDYPEIGTPTFWTAELAGSVYLIKATTTFPLDPTITKTEEWYYVKDLAPIGTWGSEDIYTDDLGNANTKFRSKFETTFASGSVRKEIITEDSSAGTGYALFDINESLVYDSVAVVADTTLNSALNQWSSHVVYAQNISDYIDAFFGILQEASIKGDRYYAQAVVNGQLTETYIFKESGKATFITLNADGTVIEIDSRGKEMFTGIVRMQVVGSEKTIRGLYTIQSKTGDVTVQIDNDVITWSN